MNVFYKIIKLALILSLAIIASCMGGSDDDREPGINASGTWKGIFAEDIYPHEVELTVSQDSEDILRGDGMVKGYYGSVVGSANPEGAYLRFESYDTITCCLPLFGCYDKEYMTLAFNGKLEGSALVDPDAWLDYGCNIPALEAPLTLYRQ